MEMNGDWNANEMFDLYLYNHLKMKNMHQTAEAFRRETGHNTDREITPDEDFLREWWGINYDILQSSLQRRQQVPQGGVSAEAETLTRTREEDVNNAQVLEAGTSRNPGKLPMNLTDSSQMSEHPSAVSLSAELQQHQLFRQFLDENTSAGTRSSQQQQVYPEQDQARLAKGKTIATENTTRATTDQCSAAKVSDLGTGSSIDAGLTRRLPLPLPLTGWPLTAGGSIGPQPDPLGSANHFLREVSLESQFMPTPGRRQGHFFQLHTNQVDNRSTILGSYADHAAPRPAISSNSLKNASDKSLVEGRQSDELRHQMQQLKEISEAHNFMDVHYKHNHEKVAAEFLPTLNSTQAENSSMHPSSFFKQNHSEWKRKPEGIFCEEIGCLQSKNKLLCCNFSSNGKLLASAGHDRKVFIWSMDTFKMTKTPQAHSHAISDVRFCPNSTVFATSSFDRTLGIWDANGGKPLCMLVGHTEAVTSLDFHPSNVNVLCSSHIYGEIRLWNVNQGVCLRVSKDSPQFPLTYRHGASKQVRFDPRGGNLLAAASGNTIRIIDVETDSTQLYLEGHKDAVRVICWDLSGRFIASVSEDSARIFSIASGGKCIYELPSNGYSFHSCTFHPRYSELLVLGSYQSIGLWNPIEGSKSISHSVHEGIVAALSASPQTGMVASASHDECIKLWK